MISSTKEEIEWKRGKQCASGRCGLNWLNYSRSTNGDRWPSCFTGTKKKRKQINGKKEKHTRQSSSKWSRLRHTSATAVDSSPANGAASSFDAEDEKFPRNCSTNVMLFLQTCTKTMGADCPGRRRFIIPQSVQQTNDPHQANDPLAGHRIRAIITRRNVMSSSHVPAIG